MNERWKRLRRAGSLCACGMLAGCFLAGGQGAGAQGAAAVKPMTRTERSDLMQTAPIQTFYLKYASQPNDGNEILTGLRLILDPSVKLYLVPSQNAIVVRGLPEDLALAAKLIAGLDRPRASFRLTYVVTEMDGTHRVSSQRYAMTLLDGQRKVMKEGVKVPVATGKYDLSSTQSETQMTYLDVGLSFDSTVTALENGGVLKSNVERSSLGEDKVAAGQDPTIRQTLVNGVSMVTLGKTSSLGTVDMPGSTHRLEFEVMLEKLP